MPMSHRFSRPGRCDSTMGSGGYLFTSIPRGHMLLSLSSFFSSIFMFIFPLLAKRVLSGSVGSVGGCVFLIPSCFQLLYGRTYSAAILRFLFPCSVLREAPEEISANFVLKKKKQSDDGNSLNDSPLFHGRRGEKVLTGFIPFADNSSGSFPTVTFSSLSFVCFSLRLSGCLFVLVFFWVRGWGGDGRMGCFLGWDG